LNIHAHGGTENASIVLRYYRALEEIPLCNAGELIQALNKITEHDPRAILNTPTIPPRLQELYTLARIHKDNYFCALAEFVMEQAPLKDPDLEEKRTRMIEGRDGTFDRRVYNGKNSGGSL